jgi:hypothetical protein
MFPAMAIKPPENHDQLPWFLLPGGCRTPGGFYAFPISSFLLVSFSRLRLS